MPTLFEQLGGEVALRQVIDRFIDRVFGDPMIGFFFAQVDKQRIKDKEYEFAAAHLGAPVTYTGRPISSAHARHSIMGGHFMRRLQILKECMSDFELPVAVQEHWIAHTEKLRPAVTADAGSECNTGQAGVGRTLPLTTKVKTARRELPVIGGKKEQP